MRWIFRLGWTIRGIHTVLHGFALLSKKVFSSGYFSMLTCHLWWAYWGWINVWHYVSQYFEVCWIIIVGSRQWAYPMEPPIFHSQYTAQDRIFHRRCAKAAPWLAQTQHRGGSARYPAVFGRGAGVTTEAAILLHPKLAPQIVRDVLFASNHFRQW